MNDSQTTSVLSPKRILLVDDAQQVADTIKSVLVEFGHRVDLAADAQNALHRFQPEKYDLVITDYAMPKMNGVEVATAIRKRAPGQLILLVTAYAFSIAAKDGRQLPVDSILHKPFSPRELERALTEVFAAAKETA